MNNVVASNTPRDAGGPGMTVARFRAVTTRSALEGGRAIPTACWIANEKRQDRACYRRQCRDLEDASPAKPVAPRHEEPPLRRGDRCACKTDAKPRRHPDQPGATKRDPRFMPRCEKRTGNDSRGVYE